MKVKNYYEADAQDILRASVNKSNSYHVDAKDVKELSSIDPAQVRVEYATDAIGKIIPGFTNAGWSNQKDSDPDYSGYTSTTISGDRAIDLADKLIDAVRQGKVNQAEEDVVSLPDEKGETQKIYRYTVDGFDDAQIFYDESTDEMTLVVRPIEIPQQVVMTI